MDDRRGLAAFLQVSLATLDYNRVARFVGGGLVYSGVLTGPDRAGMTFAHAVFSAG